MNLMETSLQHSIMPGFYVTLELGGGGGMVVVVVGVAVSHS